MVNIIKKKRPNLRSKMQRTNGKVRAWLIANGYKNSYAFPHGRFQKDYHISHSGITGDFDGIATCDNRIVLYQIKTNCRATKKVLREYKAFESIFGIEVIWFNYVNRSGLEINNQPAESYES